MTPSRTLRPVLVCLSVAGLGLSTASCGADPHRFETLAHSVADIPLEDVVSGRGQPSQDASASAQAQGLRPALAPSEHSPNRLKVEVMDPHDLWDARDADLRGRVGDYAPALIQAAAPALAGAVVRAVSDRVDQARLNPARADQTQALRPAIRQSTPRTASPMSKPGPSVPALNPAALAIRTTIQLGAYSSETAARSAWTTVSTGAGRTALHGLAPVFERVMVNGRPFTRLKVAAPAAAAVAICRAAEVSDPWCARAL
ncbi:hypothetical protein BH10PSE2_BH10PSE2_27070 [soil metagenome]